MSQSCRWFQQRYFYLREER